MTYVSIEFYIFVLIAVLLYYMIPLKGRWIVLLCGSIFFYWKALETGTGILVILATILIAYSAGLLLQKKRHKKNVRAQA